jgi:hypothetical protein
MSAAGIPLGSAVGDLSEVKLDSSLRAGEVTTVTNGEVIPVNPGEVTTVTASDVTTAATVTGELKSRVGQSRIQGNAAVGETTGTVICSQNDPSPSERRGGAWTSSIPTKAEPGTEFPRSVPMDARSPIAPCRLSRKETGSGQSLPEVRPGSTLGRDEGGADPADPPGDPYQLRRTMPGPLRSAC